MACIREKPAKRRYRHPYCRPAGLSSQPAGTGQQPGRYRPEGRQVGLAIGREFDERLYEVRDL